MNRPILLIVLGVLIFIVGLWLTIVYSISYASGWQKLAQTYLTNEVPAQTKTCRCLFGQSSTYTGVVEYATNQSGLYLKTIRLFSIGHKPLFIPWSAMKDYKSGHLAVPYKHRLMSFSAYFTVDGLPIYIDPDVKGGRTLKKRIKPASLYFPL